MDLFWLAPLSAIVALAFAGYLAWRVLKEDPGNKKMQDISAAIRKGATAYLHQQYKVVSIFFIVVFIALFILSLTDLISVFAPYAFATGGFFSALAGFVGMNIATKANCRTAQAARKSLNASLRVAFSSGAVMGLSTVGMMMVQLLIWYYFLTALGKAPVEIASVMLTIAMGASSMSLFARVGGGIYTKAADVGADLVGKVEAGIPEDDPRNPAVIADNVGDNVGDVAGMGADLFDSYTGAIVATMALGAAAFTAMNENMVLNSVLLPLIIAAVGLLASVAGVPLVKARGGDNQSSLLWAMRRGVYGSSIITAILAYPVIGYTIGWENIGVYFSVLAGLIGGLVIGYTAEYYTSNKYGPTRAVAAQSQTGPATVIIAGMAVGMKSTLLPVIAICMATMAAFFLAGGGDNPNLGLYGIGIAAVGMLSTLGITLATDAYSPVADNAGGIAEMSHLEEEVRDRTDALDALGNTIAATGKGFAIGAAALTALALIAAFRNEVLVTSAAMGKPMLSLDLQLTNPVVMVGLFIGGMLPFLFSSMTMSAVGRAAGTIVQEVRRQFREIKGLLAGEAEPDYARCVAISTKAAQHEMILPSLIAIIAPITMGVLLGPIAVAALLAGSLVTGFVMALFMANAGATWDNAKKYIEAGNFGGKGSDNHKAAVVGDTLGDPFKDTSGPSLNTLITLMAIVSIVFVGVFIALH